MADPRGNEAKQVYSPAPSRVSPVHPSSRRAGHRTYTRGATADLGMPVSLRKIDEPEMGIRGN